jgi:hypothetical protein
MSRIMNQTKNRMECPYLKYDTFHSMHVVMYILYRIPRPSSNYNPIVF